MDEPASASLLAGFLNSRHFGDVQPDLLASPDLARPVLSNLGAGAVTPARLAVLRQVRTALTAVIGDDPGEAGRAAAWDELSVLLSSVTFRLAFSPGAGSLLQVSGDEAAGAIGLAITGLANAGVWDRLRLCANPGCLYAFFDTTRSRTRRWHSYEICGNRLNVAAHRARAASG